ncbi:MAG: glutaminyl-peptide cyclotransferase [Acidobacteria bacterium]|jgi:glutaminyl-peptide cyclotransferase|nr:MAG: glutaminyl-peptide cyclotransferase [Acidobacteriota bacterium]GIU82550.1 MAG: glutamine cyclotransferase [Pyrinomonadaceae bacterium]
MRVCLSLILIAFCIFGCDKKAEVKEEKGGKSTGVPTYTYEVVKVYPHDPKAFTQGLVYHNGYLYEGTGGRKDDDFHSSLRKVELETGKVLQKIDLPGEYFGEGIAILNNKIYQLTWQENTVFVYDLETFRLLKKFTYSGEGWGLTTDGVHLFMSDGTHVIRVVDPEKFETIRTIVVLDEKGKPIMRLNELEYIKGEIWANVWEKTQIVRIDPNSGKLLGRIDLTKLVYEVTREDERADVLNGIAYDAVNDRIFITGKKWRKLFEIRLKEK